ncbi:MAG: isoleucine--tRNA ligase [Candidatus Saccharimonadales bacterium]
MSSKKAEGKSEFAYLEENLLKTWQKEQTFAKSLENRQGKPRFNFNDGPPFANGLPHFGHSLVTTIKDSVLRYKTMRGYYTPRRNGWDCHGLPVEYDVEKQFGVSGKKQIEDLGLEKFNDACRASIFRYKDQWEDFLNRIGRWSDYQNYYATVDTNYTESVWWVLSQIHQKGLLYRGFKSLPYCPRCETPLSNFELNEGYKDDVVDPSVFVLFPLKGQPKTYFLVWTTTPWTLPANAALAVDPAADYAYVKLKTDGSTLILAKERLDVLDLRQNDYQILKTATGKDLIGQKYEALYQPKAGSDKLKNAFQVYGSAGVDLEDGTGILHIAPRYGEEDLNLGLKHDLPLIESVDKTGHLVIGPSKVIGLFFKEADAHIIADLTKASRIFAAEEAPHTYPFCWRCDTPLMYFATTTWFVEVTKVKQDMLKTAAEINWMPANIKNGRFGQWLEGSRDWAISRNRYWGAPMPIWQNVDNPDDFIVISSIAELKKLAGKDEVERVLQTEGSLDLHRPFIDKITIKKDGRTYKRIEEVLDCWFESGAMPVAQIHYPFENKKLFDQTFPADFVTEGLDQTRLWFYVQHVISTILFNRPAYKNVVVNGIILAADGQKLSKRLRNYPPNEEVFDKEGADAWRLYLMSSVQATETADYLRFNRAGVTDVQRNILLTLFNSYRFFKTYSELDKWQPSELKRTTSSNLLDHWILARLDEATAIATKNADSFRLAHSLEAIFGLVDDISNWYIRRCRRRFWKSEDDSDKQNAYATLHHVLLQTCQLLAPFAPFLTDEIWRGLIKGTKLPKSVHLSDWPSVNPPNKASQKLLSDMQIVRNAISEGLSQRAKAGIKVRQPLGSVSLSLDIANMSAFEGIIAEELNVKEVKWAKNGEVKLDTKLTDELKAEGIARDLIRAVQSARKNAGFNVEDRIRIRIYMEDPGLAGALNRFKKTIYDETLVVAELEQGEKAKYNENLKIDGHEVSIHLSRQG